MEARGQGNGRAGGILQAALAWPLVGWLLGSWLDEAEPAVPARDPDARRRAASALLDIPSIAMLAPRRGPRTRHALIVATAAVVVAVVPAAAVGRPQPASLRETAVPRAPASAEPASARAAALTARFAGEARDEVEQARRIASGREAVLRAAWPDGTAGLGASSRAAGGLEQGTTFQAPIISDARIPAPQQRLIHYRAQDGDALWTIARRFSVSTMTVWWANDLPTKDDVRRGQLITLPRTSGVVHVVVDGDTLDSIARAYRANPNRIAAANGLEGGVVLLGQRLIIPRGHGPKYQPRVGSDLPTRDLALQPRAARNGAPPASGPALVPGADASAPDASPQGTKTMIAGGPAAVLPDPGSENDPGDSDPGGSPGVISPDQTGDGPDQSPDAGIGDDPGQAPDDSIGANPGQTPHHGTGSYTSPTVDQAGARQRGSSPPVVGISISRWDFRSGQSSAGAEFGPTGGLVDQPHANPRPTTADDISHNPIGSLTGPITGVAIDLSGLFATQFDGSLFASGNCNMAAGAMLLEVQAGLRVTGGQMRAWSGATTRGTSLEDLQRAFASQGQPLTIRRYMPWSTFVKAVASGRSAVVQGWYGYLPSRYVLQPGFVSGHSIFVLGYSPHMFHGGGGFYVMDPLGRSGYSGEWWPASVLRAYGWSGEYGHAGEGTRLSYLGFVALQATHSHKQLGHAPKKPAFQNYWQTTKDALEAALRVTVLSRGGNVPAIRGLVLLIRDPHLALTAERALQTNALRWPLSGIATIVRGFTTHHPMLDIAGPAGARVRAAANGRVIFQSWREAGGTQTIWIEHGPNLFTAYSGLANVRVTPGEWVSGGAVLGTLARNPSAMLRFAVSVGGLPSAPGARVDPGRLVEAR